MMRAPKRVIRAGNERVEIESLDELRAMLSARAGQGPGEVWLEHAAGSRMCMLHTGNRALLMFQAGDGDPGLLGRIRDAPVTSGTVRFTLSNGQRDEYPTSLTVTLEEAMAALEHFFGTSELTPLLEWSAAS